MPRQRNLTDDEILSRIPGLGNDEQTNNDDVVNNDGEENNETPANTTQDNGGQDEPAEGVEQRISGDSGGGTANTTPQPTQPKGQQPKGKDQNARNPGDLVDRQGNVIARAGAERRHYENFHRERTAHMQTQQQLRGAQNELRELRGKVQVYESSANAQHEMGLSPQESVAAMRLFSQFKTNPVGTIQFLLGEARALGHNVDGLDQGAVNAHAINKLLDQRLAPLTAQAEEERRRQQVQEETTRQVTEFYTRYPDAHTHDAAIGALVERNPTLTPSEAYWMLREYFTRNGFDWSIPLEANLQAASGRGQQQQQQQQQRTQQQIRTLPNGRGGLSVQTQQQRTVPANTALADEDESWENIIRTSMRDGGMRV